MEEEEEEDKETEEGEEERGRGREEKEREVGRRRGKGMRKHPAAGMCPAVSTAPMTNLQYDDRQRDTPQWSWKRVFLKHR